MNYDFNEQTNQMLSSLEKSIIEEYDKTQEISVRVDLLPEWHNTMGEFEKVVEENGEIHTTVNSNNEEHSKTLVAIHEATPGRADGSMPTKPEKYKTDITYYDRLIRYGAKKREYGSTIGYHAMIAYPGLLNRPEIVIFLPATSSPDQINNKDIGKYAYGIERLCGQEQNYHLAIANQAMLSAFVLRELGYDKESAMRHVFPHNFYSKTNKECPARMLYATRLLQKTKEGVELSNEELEIIQEYVPWQVFSNLVGTFLERDRYPEELEKKFIMDMSDYKAYTQNPETYDYSERKKHKVVNNNKDDFELTGKRSLRDSIARATPPVDDDLDM